MFVPVVYRTAYRIVNEKESRAKESMKMMGLKDFPYFLSWWCYYTTVNTILCLLCTLVLMTLVMTYSNGFVVFIYLWLFGQSAFGLVLTVQSLFTKSRSAAITSTIVYFGSALLGGFVRKESTPRLYKMIASISPTVAFTQGVKTLAMFETTGIGLNFSNIDE